MAVEAAPIKAEPKPANLPKGSIAKAMTLPNIMPIKKKDTNSQSMKAQKGGTPPSPNHIKARKLADVSVNKATALWLSLRMPIRITMREFKKDALPMESAAMPK